MRRAFLIAVPYLWLLALFLVPFAIVLRISFSDIALSIPPYAPVLDTGEGVWAGLRNVVSQFDFENYVFLTEDDLYWKAYLSSLQIAALSTFFTLLVGFPIAYAMARAPQEWRATLMMLIILPFWTSFLIRVYAWIGILGTEGYLNQVLIAAGLIDAPLTILNTQIAVYIGIVYLNVDGHRNIFISNGSIIYCNWSIVNWVDSNDDLCCIAQWHWRGGIT